MISTPSSPSVLIVGGGLVGLSAGLFLQQLGVPFMLIEKNTQVSVLPRARGIHLRTMELFRQLGLEDAIIAAVAQAWKQGSFGGARRGRSLMDAAPIVDIAAMQTKMAAAAPSPSSFGACPQTMVEPILRDALETRGGDVRFGHELLSFVEENHAIRAKVRNLAGQEYEVEAAWLIGADGARSPVRRQLGISTTTMPALQHLINVFFHAKLARAVEGRTFSQCEIANDKVRGLFLAMNNTDKWSFHLEYDPAKGPPPMEDYPRLIRAAIGIDDIEIDILASSFWNTGVAVAERYRIGRVFLSGDAAHLMPPWGGFNATTGIADAHNLAWKLAAVLREDADATLLDSYAEERHPLAVRCGRQAQLRTDFDARFGIPTEANAAIFPQLEDSAALSLRYRYPMKDSLSADTSDSVIRLQGQIGTRFPHAWINIDGRKISTLDLFGTGYVLIAGPASPATPSRLKSLNAEHHAVYVAGVDFDFDDRDIDWRSLTGLPDDGEMLVRPDGFVAARSSVQL